MDEDKVYLEPRLEDYGSLTDLTAAFDADTLTHVAKGAISLAVVSTLPGGGILPGTGGGAGTGTPGTGVMGENVSGGNGAPGTNGTNGAQGSEGGGGGETAGVGASSGGGGGSGSGGRLPFTGLNVILIASVGAGLTATGARARRALRRDRED